MQQALLERSLPSRYSAAWPNVNNDKLCASCVSIFAREDTCVQQLHTNQNIEAYVCFGHNYKWKKISGCTTCLWPVDYSFHSDADTMRQVPEVRVESER